MDGEQPGMENLSFEQAFQRLQATIAALEEGGLPLDESIERFEEGMRLANLCTSMIDQAELKVSRLLAGGEELQDGFSLEARDS
ncbi:MAG TPA: exodeoxyribonuclease VII small subunit [Chloroflexota bacterium]|nr:exodeoxyribonuclease VII small subunit [Chloroflexota bacterium]